MIYTNLRYKNLIEIPKLPWFVWDLDLSYNKIKEIKNMPWFVWNLDLSFNKIKEIKNLPWFVWNLDLSNNKITKVKNLPRSIFTLDLCYNKIKNTTSTVANTNIHSNKNRKKYTHIDNGDNRIKSSKHSVSYFDLKWVKDYSYVEMFESKNKYLNELYGF
jgi:hypothetical protein